MFEMLYGKDKESAKRAIEIALKAGASGVRVTLNRGCVRSIGVLNGKIDKMQMCNDRSLYIQLFLKGRYGAFSTNMLDKESVERFIKEAADIVKVITPDENRTLPSPELYYNGGYKELGQFDKKILEITDEERKAIAFAVYGEMEGKSVKPVSAESEYSDYLNYEYMVDSQGFEGEILQSDFDVTAECSIKGDTDARYESFRHSGSITFDELEYAGCGSTALAKAVEKMNPKHISGGKYGMVVENVAASRLVAPLFNALSGSAIEQKRSFLLNSLDKRVLGENLSIYDRPHLYGKSGSRYYDSEGIATKEMPIIENGIVKTYYINSYNANKLKCKPTVDSPSVPLFEKSIVESGNKCSEAMMKRMGKGIFITGFNGGNCNTTTGDFSYGIEGFYFNNGTIEHPVREMNITGNMVNLWNHFLCCGNDAPGWTRWQTPTLSFGDTDFNGLD